MNNTVNEKLRKRILEDIMRVLKIIFATALIIGLLALGISIVLRLYNIVTNRFTYITVIMSIFLFFLGTIKFLLIYIDKHENNNVDAYGYEKVPILNILVPVLNNLVILGISNLFLLIFNFVLPNALNVAVVLSLLFSVGFTLCWYIIDPFGQWFDNLLDYMNMCDDEFEENEEEYK